jgi:hypothetical protein
MAFTFLVPETNKREVELSRSIDRYVTAQRDSRLPWSICLPIMIILSLASWMLILLAVHLL